jgi:LmbE family N-acetylglucosaminyl deacetylase
MIPAIEARALIEALPERPFEAVFGGDPILILSPHQDDESLGCGGMIAAATSRSVPVHIAFLTDGGMSHPGSRAWPRARLISHRRDEALSAAAILGVPPGEVTFLEQPDRDAPHDGPAFDAVLERLSALAGRLGARTICASWIGDPHGDHGSAAKLARAACTRAGLRHLAYPIWAWAAPDAAPMPTVMGGARLDIAPYLPLKRRAIAAHASQHGALIDDDPSGFVLPAKFLAWFDRPWEAFLEQP